ncbi:unnamed protein product [Strongylus vulgaris]|uniref:Uncharacterized protein n=1 Tax=Strongylus vulgaris TaxID=40348 RepID=A0A3P7IYC1_STRVU|nr:unnamed protein product [Strongylus vulgaris]
MICQTIVSCTFIVSVDLVVSEERVWQLISSSTMMFVYFEILNSITRPRLTKCR